MKLNNFHYKTKTTNENVFDRVDEWIGGDEDVPLYEYLGITLEEYEHWMQTGNL